MAGSNGHLYLHEQGVDADGAVMPAHVTLAPMQIMEGVRLGEIQGLLADFERQTGAVTVTMTSYERMNERLESESNSFPPGTGLVDFRLAGRHVSLTIRSAVLGGDFRLGKPLLDVKASGGRRR